MNIFETYLDKIIKLIKSAKEDNLLELPENLSGINVDIPPAKFNCDMSTNVAMVLSKTNNKSPVEIAELITDIIKKNDENLDNIKIEKPGFINLKFKKSFWNNFLESIINDNKYGSKKLNNPGLILIEIDITQVRRSVLEASKYFPDNSISILKDCFDNDRFLKIELS